MMLGTSRLESKEVSPSTGHYHLYGGAGRHLQVPSKVQTWRD